jgi:hypothetical protein
VLQTFLDTLSNILDKCLRFSLIKIESVSIFQAKPRLVPSSPSVVYTLGSHPLGGSVIIEHEPSTSIQFGTPFSGVTVNCKYFSLEGASSQPYNKLLAICLSVIGATDLGETIPNPQNPDTLNFDTLEKLKKINLETLPEVPSSTRIGSCITKPGKFIAIGLNYSDHAAETNAEIPKEPIVFNKAISSMVGPNDNIVLPKLSKKLDWEIEIAFIVGKYAKYISEKNAANHILGYCIVNDVSEREWQIERGGLWDKGKSGDTFGPTGPYLVTKDDIKDVQNLSMSLEIGRAHV